METIKIMIKSKIKRGGGMRLLNLNLSLNPHSLGAQTE
jgi:hypothetical protein